jgi:hypothetical protein
VLDAWSRSSRKLELSLLFQNMLSFSKHNSSVVVSKEIIGDDLQLPAQRLGRRLEARIPNYLVTNYESKGMRIWCGIWPRPIQSTFCIPSDTFVRSPYAHGKGSCAHLPPLQGDLVRVSRAHVGHRVFNGVNRLPNHVHSIPLGIMLGFACDSEQRKVALKFLITPCIPKGDNTCSRFASICHIGPANLSTPSIQVIKCTICTGKRRATTSTQSISPCM